MANNVTPLTGLLHAATIAVGLKAKSSEVKAEFQQLHTKQAELIGEFNDLNTEALADIATNAADIATNAAGLVTASAARDVLSGRLDDLEGAPDTYYNAGSTGSLSNTYLAYRTIVTTAAALVLTDPDLMVDAENGLSWTIVNGREAGPCTVTFDDLSGDAVTRVILPGRSLRFIICHDEGKDDLYWAPEAGADGPVHLTVTDTTTLSNLTLGAVTTVSIEVTAALKSLTLPELSTSYPSGRLVSLHNASAYTFTVSRSGSDEIGAGSSVQLSPDESLTLMSMPTGRWIIVGNVTP